MADGGGLARATEQAAIARIDKFVRDAGALGLRVQRMTIAPATVRHNGHTRNEPGPALLFSEESSPGPCVVTVEPPTAATGSCGGRTYDNPVEPPSDCEAESELKRRAGTHDSGHHGGTGNGAGRGFGGENIVGASGAGASMARDGQRGVSVAAGHGNSGS